MLASVNSKSRVVMLYGLARAANKVAKVKHFLVDIDAIGTSRWSRCNNGGEFLYQQSVDFCDSRIRREIISPDIPK